MICIVSTDEFLARHREERVRQRLAQQEEKRRVNIHTYDLYSLDFLGTNCTCMLKVTVHYVALRGGGWPCERAGMLVRTFELNPYGRPIWAWLYAFFDC